MKFHKQAWMPLELCKPVKVTHDSCILFLQRAYKSDSYYLFQTLEIRVLVVEGLPFQGLWPFEIHTGKRP